MSPVASGFGEFVLGKVISRKSYLYVSRPHVSKATALESLHGFPLNAVVNDTKGDVHISFFSRDMSHVKSIR